MIGRGRFESEGAEGEPGAGGRREICCNMNRMIGPVALESIQLSIVEGK